MMHDALSSRGKNIIFPWGYSVTSMPFHLKTAIISSIWDRVQPLEDKVSAAFPRSMSIGSAGMAMMDYPPQRREVVNLIRASPEALWNGA